MLKNIFLLRGNLPRWAIPLAWSIFLLNFVFNQFWMLWSTYQNFGFPDYPRWMILRDILPKLILWLPSLIPNFAYIAMLGIGMMAAQKILFTDSNKTEQKN